MAVLVLCFSNKFPLVTVNFIGCACAFHIDCIITRVDSLGHTGHLKRNNIIVFYEILRSCNQRGYNKSLSYNYNDE